MKKIMVVDDNPDVRLSIKQALEHLDDEYTVICVDSGNSCYEMLENNEIPDIILLDIMMPGMSGWMLTDRLQENPSWRDIPVIFLTCRTDDFARKAASPFCEDYIEKPFDIKDLQKRIEKVFKKLDLRKN